MDIRLGRVTKIVDDHKFVIKATIDNLIEDVIAYPIDTFDQPEEGNPVFLYEIESVFGYSYMWKKLRLTDYTKMKLKSSEIKICHDHILIQSGSEEVGEVKDKGGKSWVRINADGSIEVYSENKIIVNTKEIETTADDSIKINTKTCTITANDVNITGGNLTTTKGGTCSPTGMGGFCAIPICPLTGVTHLGNKITGT